MPFKAEDWVKLPKEKMCNNERRDNRTRLQWTEDYSNIQKTCRKAASKEK